MAKEKDTAKRAGVFRLFFKTFFDIPAWLGLKQLKDTNKTLGTYLKDTYKVKQANRTETFEQALKRLNVTEADLAIVVKNNTRNFYIMVAFAVALLVYGIYLLILGSVGAALLDLVVIGLVLVRVFQFSFWNFQIRQKRLGCSFKEWLSRGR
jgi:intracellular multiplication protein IcmV